MLAGATWLSWNDNKSQGTRRYGGENVTTIEPDFAEKHKLKLEEIAGYRQKLGLTDMPKELGDLLYMTPAEIASYCEWEGDPPEYQVEVPAKNVSYAARNWETLVGAFSRENASRLVAGAKGDLSYPDGMSFEPATRFCCIGDNIHNRADIDIYTDYALHEACGHGSDPSIGAKYPPEVLISVEHGRWRALSTAFEIKGQFLNHPSDGVYPYFKRKLGYTVALMARGYVQYSPVEISYEDQYQTMMQDIATQRGVTVAELKFNKAVCREIGQRLSEGVRSNTIKLSEYMHSYYQKAFESGLVEIYAEMFKYALRYPDLIGYDTDVIEGITEVCNAISGNIRRPDDIRRATLSTSPEIRERNGREKAYLAELSDAMSPEERALIQKQEEEFARKEQAFSDFCKGGIKTDLLAKGNEVLMGNYITVYAKVLNKYPMLKDTFGQHLNKSFDPNLDIWDIEKVEYSMDTGFVREVLLNPKQRLTPEQETSLAGKIATLGDFVNGPAF